MLTKDEIKELRKQFFDNSAIQTRAGFLHAILFAGTYILDDEVFLPTKGRFLQRGYVWELWRKKSFIISLFSEAPQKPMAFINKPTYTAHEVSKLEVIDGKQRINAIKEFFSNKFAIELGGKEYFAADFGDKTLLCRIFLSTSLPVFWIDEGIDDPISDQQKKDFFKWLNLDTHPQDEERINNL